MTPRKVSVGAIPSASQARQRARLLTVCVCTSGEVTEVAPSEVDLHEASTFGKRKRKTAVEALEFKLEECPGIPLLP